MIQSIKIKGLRGIREGDLADLTPFVILVGPNGCGKSTVLDAILIGASAYPLRGVEAVVRRHEGGGIGPRWLFWRAGEHGPAKIITHNIASESIAVCDLRIEQGQTEATSEIILQVHKDGGQNEPGRPFTRIQDGRINCVNNKLTGGETSYTGAGLEAEVNLIEPYSSSSARSLPDLYTDIVRKGRRKKAIEIFAELVPGFVDIEILTENGVPILHFVFEDHSVPVTLGGDGIHSLLRQSLELAASSGGVALLEEPEVHKHPGAIRQSALAILAAVRRQIQVILSTHSLELIDSLLSACSDEDLKSLSLYRLLLQGGKLISSRLDGPDVAFARAQIEDDLRCRFGRLIPRQGCVCSTMA